MARDKLYIKDDPVKSKLKDRKRKHGEDRNRISGSPSHNRRILTRTRGRKGKMIPRETSSSSDSESEHHTVSRKRRPKKWNTPILESGYKQQIGGKGGPLNELLDASTSEYSSDELEQEPKNCFGSVSVRQRMTYYRSNIKTTIKQIKSLHFNERHIREIKKTPFWLLFEAIHKSETEKLKYRCHKHEDDIRRIMMAFDFSSESFMIGGERLSLSNRDVQLIFGVSGGSAPIPLKVAEYEMPGWIRRCFGREIDNSNGPYVLYKKHIFDKLQEKVGMHEETSFQDVARLTHAYLMTSLLAMNQNSEITWHFTRYLENFEEICIFDWCTLIVDLLKVQIKSSKSMKAGGCAILLPFWLCEHMSLIKPVNELAFPRFLRWDLNELNEKLQQVDLCQLKPKYIRRLVLKPTSVEKEIFRSLLNFWKAECRKKCSHQDSNDDDSGKNARSSHSNCIVSGTDDKVEPTLALGASVAKTVIEGLLSSLDIPTTSNKGGSNHVSEKPFLFSENVPGSLRIVDDSANYTRNHLPTVLVDLSTIEDIKAEMYEQDIPPDTQHLIFAGRHLDGTIMTSEGPQSAVSQLTQLNVTSQGQSNQHKHPAPQLAQEQTKRSQPATQTTPNSNSQSILDASDEEECAEYIQGLATSTDCLAMSHNNHDANLKVFSLHQDEATAPLRNLLPEFQACPPSSVLTELEDVKRELATSRSREKELEATISGLTNENKELSSRCASYEIQTVALEAENKKSKEELMVACTKKKELEASYESRIAALEVENKEIKEELMVAYRKEKEQEATISGLTNKNKVLSAQCDSYESQIFTLEAENKKTIKELMVDCSKEKEVEAIIPGLTRKNKVHASYESSQIVALEVENEKTKEELMVARSKEKVQEATISRLTHKNKVISAQCASYESQVVALEIENKKTKEELMVADKKYYSGARAAGYAEGLKEGKTKWLKSLEFFHHLTEASMQYFDYGFDSCQKQAEQKGFVGQLNKDSALKEAPEFSGWESGDQPN